MKTTMRREQAMGSSMDVRPVCVGRVVGLSLGKFAYVGGLLGLLALAAPALAGPEGEHVAAGSAQFSRQGDLTVIQAANNTIIDYASFNIAQHETVQFVQPGAASRVLNRVYGQLPTHIDGTLTANGMVYFANPAGIYFGGQAIVNVGGLVAAAGTITNTDFLSGVDHFSNLSGTVENLGTIHAQTAHFVGRHVVNRGTVISPGGLVTMTAGEDVYLGKRDGHLFVRIEGAASAGPDSAGVENSGKVSAGGGRAVMMAGDMAGLAIRQTGSVKAADVHVEGTGAGEVRISGTIDASDNFFGRGGQVTVTGERVAVDDALIDASGSFEGGDVRIGGDYQGRGDLRTSKRTIVSSDSRINADARISGDGGRVIVWSDGLTAFGGEISARGGAMGGDGGFAEVSGKSHLIYQGKADLRAAKGSWGELLLDPTNIVVDDMGVETADLTTVDEFADMDVGMDGDTVLDVASINNAAAMANVTLQATNDITFDAPIVTVNDNVSLAAVAGNDVVVNEAITLRGGTISFTANSSATAGQTGSGSIDINAPMSTTGGGLTGGAINLFVDGGTGTIDLGGNLSTAGGAVTLNNDAIVLTANAVIDTDPAGANTNAGAIVFAGNSTTTGAFTLSLDASADGTGASADVNLGAVNGASSLTVAGADLDLRGDLSITGPIDLSTGLASITLFDNEQTGQAGTGTQIDNTGGMNDAISLASVTGDFDLDVASDASSAMSFGAIDVNSLDVSGGTSTLNGDITADTGINFSMAGAITLGGNRSLTSSNGGTPTPITFGAGNTITGAQTLALNGGAVTLHQVGDGATDPTSLTVNATTLTLNDDITVDGPVNLRTNVGSITLAANSTIDASGGTNAAISLANTTGNFDLALTGDAMGSPLTLGATDVNSLALTGGTLSLNGNITSDTALNFTNVEGIALGANTAIAAINSDGGNALQTITFDAANVITGARTLNLNGSTIQLFQVGNGASDPTSLTVTAGTSLTVNSPITVDGPVNLAGSAALSAPAGMTINTTGAAPLLGVIALPAFVTNQAVTLTAQPNSAISLRSTDVDSLAISGGSLQLNGALESDSALDFTNINGGITLTGASSIVARDSDGGNAPQNITFDAMNTITGAQTLNLLGDTIALFGVGNTVADPTQLVVTANNLGLNSAITVDGPVNLRMNVGAIALNANVAINNTGGANNSISLANTTGDFNLTLTGDASSPLTLGTMDVNGLSLTGGAVTLHGNITSDTALSFANAGAITLAGPVTIAAGEGGTAQNITFDAGNTITGAQTLALDGDTVTLFQVGDGAADPTSLSVTADTALSLNDDITVDGPVDLRTNVAAITLAGNSTIDVTGGTNAAISLANAAGNFDLALTGDSGAGGSALTLGATDVNSLALTGGALNLNGNVTSDAALNFTNVEAIGFTGATTIAARDSDAGGAAQSITFDTANTITGAGALALDGGAVTLFQVGDGATDPASFSVTSTGLSLNGDITVDGPVDLATNVAAISLDGNSTITTTGATAGNGPISLAFVTGNNTLALAAEAASDIALAGADIDTLTLTSGGDLAVSGDIETDTAQNYSNVGAVSVTGDRAFIAQDSDAANAAADITFDAGNAISSAGALTFNGNNVTLNQVGTGGGMDPSAVTVIADGTLDLQGQVTSAGDITLAPKTAGTTIGINNSGAMFSVSAASLQMLATPGTVTIGDAASGAITIANLGFIDLSGETYDLTLRGASATFNTNANNGIQLASDKTLTMVLASGGVATTGGTNLDAIITGGMGAGTLVVDAAGAVGSGADPLSTQVDRVAMTTSAGGLFLANTGGLTVTSAGGVDGMTATGAGAITVHATGGDAGDLIVEAPITSDTGDIALRADNDVMFTAAGDVTSMSGAISAAADFDMLNSGGAGTGGALTMSDGTVFSTSGNMSVSADGDVALAFLDATGGAATVNVTSTAGDITDANDDSAGSNVMHAAGAGATTLAATMGAVGGGGNALELALNGAPLVVNAQDGLALAVQGDLAGAFTISNGFINLSAAGTVSTTGNWSADTIAVSAGDVVIGHMLTGATSVVIDRETAGTIGVGAAMGDLTIDGAELQMIVTPSLTIGGANTTAMTVDGVTAMQSDNADMVTLAAAGSITFSGTESTFNALSVEADDGAAVNVNITTDTGALALDGDADDAADTADALAVASGVTLASTGNLSTGATTGGVTFGDAVTLNSLATATLNDATSAQGALAVNANNGVVVAGALSASNGAVVLDGDANDNGFGTLTVASTGSVNASGQSLTLRAGDVDLLGNVTTTGGTLVIERASAGSIGLGDATGDLTLDNTDLGNIAAGDATIRGASVTTLTADNAMAPGIGGVLTLDATGGAATFTNAASSFGGGLDVTATAVTFDAGVTTGGALTAMSDQDLSIGGVALTSGGPMSLTSMNNIVLTGADNSTATLDVNSDMGLTLGTLTTSGANSPNLAIESDGGVMLSDTTLNNGVLSVTVDADGDGMETATLGTTMAGAISVTGGAGETITLSQPVSTTTAAGVSLEAETVNLNSDIQTSAGGGVGVTNTGTLSIAPGVALTLDGAFGQAGGGAVELGGLILTTNDDVFFTGPITLTTDATVNTGTGAGNVDFGGSINGDSLLSVTAGTGTVTFDGRIGDVTPVSGLLVASSGGFDFNEDVVADDEGISVATSGDSTLDRAFTTTNGGGFALNNTGTVTIDPVAVFALSGDFTQSGSGTTVLTGDFGQAGLRSTFMGPVTLASDVTLRGSEFTFGGPVDSDATPRAVAFETTTFTQISGVMGGTSPLSTFTTSTMGTTRLAGGVTTTSGSVFRNPVVLTGDATVMDTGASSPGVFFNSTIDGDGGGARNLTVLVNNQTAANAANLPVIRFGADVGASQALGSLLLNFSPAAGFMERASVPAVATIVARPLDANGDAIPVGMLPDFDISFTTTGDFRMGRREKLTVLGDLLITSTGGTVRLGDVTALGDIVVNAPTIRIVAREPGNLRTNQGVLDPTLDLGTDFVAGGSIDFSVVPTVEGGDPGTVDFATPGAGNISATLSSFTRRAFGEVSAALFADGAGRLQDLKAQGPASVNVGEAIAGAVPRETRANDVGQNTTVSQGQLERLEQIGIYPRDLEPRELVEFLSGRALYYDYPRKADPGASDYLVTKRRLSAERITALLDLYDEVFRRPAVDPETGRVERTEEGEPVLVDRTQEIRQALAAAATSYRRQTGPGRIDPIGLRAFIESTPEYSQLAADLDNIGRFLDALDRVGLSRRETVNARLAILQKLAPPSLGTGAAGAATLEAMIRGERAEIAP